MKLNSLAAVLLLLPGAALAAAAGSLDQAKTDLYNDIEAWRGTQLPHTDPPAKLTVALEPRLDEIKADVRVALTDGDLAKPRKELAVWEHDLVSQKFAAARRVGLTRETLVNFSEEQRRQVAFSAALHSFIAEDTAKRSFAATSRRASNSTRNPSDFFDGARTGGDVSDGMVSAGALADAKDPARYAKVRQILMSQGASARVVDMAIREAIRQNADPLLVLAVINQESGFHTHATSSCGARGLMQLMPDTGRGLGVSNSSMLYDAQTNLRAGIRFLKSLWGQFVGGDMTAIAEINPWNSHNVKAAVAAYNAGPGAVRKYSGVPPYRETQGYVKSVLGYYERFKQYMQA